MKRSEPEIILTKRDITIPILTTFITMHSHFKSIFWYFLQVQEVNNYKQQIQSLLSELAENKHNLSLHTKKVQELHEANLQFDQV